jgi:hypothetical protein
MYGSKNFNSVLESLGILSIIKLILSTNNILIINLLDKYINLTIIEVVYD